MISLPFPYAFQSWGALRACQAYDVERAGIVNGRLTRAVSHSLGSFASTRRGFPRGRHEKNENKTLNIKNGSFWLIFPYFIYLSIFFCYANRAREPHTRIKLLPVASLLHSWANEGSGCVYERSDPSWPIVIGPLSLSRSRWKRWKERRKEDWTTIM